MDQSSLLVTELYGNEYESVKTYFNKKGAFGEEEALAHESFLKVLTHVRRNLAITYGHAKNLLWRVAPQVLCNHRRARSKHDVGRISLDRVSQPTTPTCNDPFEQSAKRELFLLVKQELLNFNDAVNRNALMRRLCGDSWESIGAEMRVSGATARIHVLKAFAGLIFSMADRGIRSHVVGSLGEQCGTKIELAIRLWARGAGRKQIAHEIDISVMEARQLLHEGTSFLLQYL